MHPGRLLGPCYLLRACGGPDALGTTKNGMDSSTREDDDGMHEVTSYDANTLGSFAGRVTLERTDLPPDRHERACVAIYKKGKGYSASWACRKNDDDLTHVKCCWSARPRPRLAGPGIASTRAVCGSNRGISCELEEINHKPTVGVRRRSRGGLEPTHRHPHGIARADRWPVGSVTGELAADAVVSGALESRLGAMIN
jgi:hypothetical protein